MSSATPAGGADQWARATAPDEIERRGGTAYGDVLALQRELQDRVAGAAPDDDTLTAVSAALRTAIGLLDGHQVPESERWSGRRPDLPGRGMSLLPPYEIEGWDEGSLHGVVTFTRFFLGGGAAAHGGSHALLFDDLMGMLARVQGGLVRTAYLTINYRRITPLDVRLTFDARVDGMDGRKRFVSARLYNPAGEVVADCAGLFLRLLPGQQ